MIKSNQRFIQNQARLEAYPQIRLEILNSQQYQHPSSGLAFIPAAFV